MLVRDVSYTLLINCKAFFVHKEINKCLIVMTLLYLVRVRAAPRMLVPTFVKILCRFAEQL